ncbi:RNaseH domain-containing protein [Streptomyces sp. NPDC001795]|uniref:RNaseH domain-containing protein n=1 Tax=Streptomyces sp. NPDC001795 TaxID=3154525 RepID=UPI00332F7413
MSPYLTRGGIGSRDVVSPATLRRRLEGSADRPAVHSCDGGVERRTGSAGIWAREVLRRASSVSVRWSSGRRVLAGWCGRRSVATAALGAARARCSRTGRPVVRRLGTGCSGACRRGALCRLLGVAPNPRRGRTCERDRLQDRLAPARRLDPDLRLVRVRAGSRNETPQWWGKAPEGKANGIQQGLWAPEGTAEDARVFFRTTAKPVQFKHAAVTADRLSSWLIAQGKRKGEPTMDTSQAAWIPGLLEIDVLGCHPDDGDDPRSFGLLTHVLRQPSDYDQALALPLPLHLAGLAGVRAADAEGRRGGRGRNGRGGAGANPVFRTTWTTRRTHRRWNSPSRTWSRRPWTPTDSCNCLTFDARTGCRCSA